MAELFAGDNGQDGTTPAEESHNGNGVAVAPELATLFEQFNALGQDLYGKQWAKVCRRNVHRISGGNTEESGELTAEQIQQLIAGMTKLKSARHPVAVPS
jgi:hypothetical protein